MKNRIILLALLVFTLVLSGCAASTPKTEAPKTDAPKAEAPKTEAPKTEKKKFKIGITQIVEHIALDEARKGFEDGLKEFGVEADITVQNAQGELTNALSITKKFEDDKMDLVYAISTPSAQAAQKNLSPTRPILFSAVTDPVQSGLVADWVKVGANVTGTSDAAPIKEQLQLFGMIDPKIKTIGVIFSTSEANSEIQLKDIEIIAKELNLEIIKVGVSNIGEVPAGVETLTSKCDGIYAITDNLVSSSIEIVAKKSIEKKKPLICSEENQLIGGGLITKGISYYEIGKQTAAMAKKILVDKVDVKDIPVEKAKNITAKFNEETAKALGLDINAEPFKSATKIEIKK